MKTSTGYGFVKGPDGRRITSPTAMRVIRTVTNQMNREVSQALIDEGIANYLALLFADSQKNANHSLRVWLGRYRQRLVEKPPGAEQSAAEIGALELGSRLTSSKSPEGFEDLG